MFQALNNIKNFYNDTKNRKKYDGKDEQSVDGKIVIITGANSGIGKATAAELAERGATVIMACRNLELAKEAVEDIRSKTQNGDLCIMELDLGDLDSIRSFAREFQNQYSQLNILINNAGISDQNGKLLKTKDGFELHMGVNHLGHFLLTNLLLDSLKKGFPSRIISVSSSSYERSNLDLDDIMLETPKNSNNLGFGNLIPYGNSKLANMLMIKTLSKKLVGTGVNCYVLCPGMVYTNTFRNQQGFNKILTKFFLQFVGLTPEQGCETILLCALSKSLDHETGQMYRFGKRLDGVMEDLSDSTAEKLWLKSAELVKLDS